MLRVHVASMSNLDTTMKRVLVNAVFGSVILLLLVLAVVFRYYIDKQTPLRKQNYHIEQTSNTK